MDRRENLLPSFLPSEWLSIDEELWQMVEKRVQEILWTIVPNVLSEANRKGVIDYVQRVIRGYYGAEVLSFGSFPLKTYLPDGDIDLTTLNCEDVEEDFAQAIYKILRSGDDSEYQVKDIQYIHAKVRLVKCIVKNITVDISFNQVARIYTLHFLEQVDKLVGKNNIFKHSIILIKAWCYYEGRLLGGHHGLLSTYALEVLVLYIINCFHSSVRDPLEVLYIFLEYYGSFDWDNNYVSIWGPKALSSLPEIVETLERDQGEFLLQIEFIKNYKNMCSFPTRTSKTMVHGFPIKFMNILDPLRNDNNLSRHVNIANLHRLRFAFSYGAEKLKQILTLSGEDMGVGLEKFFLNTLNRNGKGQRADVDVPVSPFGIGRSEESILHGDCDDLQYVQLYRNYAMPVTLHNSSSSSSPSQDDILAPSTQLNWSMFYQGGTDAYILRQPLHHPTYYLEGGRKSRGTGTYIPNLNYNSYWDMRIKASRQRRSASSKYKALPKSPPRKQQVEEAHSEETDINANLDSRLFKSETNMDGTSQMFEFSNEDFPFLSNVCSETHMEDNSRLSKLKNIEFGTYKRPQSPTTPCLPINDEKEDFDFSKLTMERKEESPTNNEMMD